MDLSKEVMLLLAALWMLHEAAEEKPLAKKPTVKELESRDEVTFDVTADMRDQAWDIYHGDPASAEKAFLIYELGVVGDDVEAAGLEGSLKYNVRACGRLLKAGTALQSLSDEEVACVPERYIEVV